MSQNRIEASHFSPDIREFIQLLNRYDVHYLIVGGEAVIYYGYARLTGDVDFFYDRRKENAQKLYQVLIDFWGGDIPGIGAMEELMEPGVIFQFGRPPNRIDLINRIDGVRFDEAWPKRNEVAFALEAGEIPLYYLGLQDLIENKHASGRPKDLEDLTYLRKALKQHKKNKD